MLEEESKAKFLSSFRPSWKNLTQYFSRKIKTKENGRKFCNSCLNNRLSQDLIRSLIPNKHLAITYLLDNDITGHITSSKLIPPCWNVSL